MHMSLTWAAPLDLVARETLTHIHAHIHRTYMHTNTPEMQRTLYCKQTLDGGRRNMFDPDEIEEEQKERERRNKINAEFNTFIKRVQVGSRVWMWVWWRGEGGERGAGLCQVSK